MNGDPEAARGPSTPKSAPARGRLVVKDVAAMDAADAQAVLAGIERAAKEAKAEVGA